MAGAAVTIDLMQVAPWLTQYADRLNHMDWSKSAAVMNQLVVSWSKELFDKSQTPDGQAWAPLKHPRSHGRGGTRPLLDTGMLRASLSALSAIEPSGFSTSWGSNLEYAAAQNYGATINRTSSKGKNYTITIPARTFLGLGDQNLQVVQTLLLEEITRQLGAAAVQPPPSASA